MFGFHRSWLRLAGLVLLALLALLVAARAGDGGYTLGLLAFAACAAMAIRVAGEIAAPTPGAESRVTVPAPTGRAGRAAAGVVSAIVGIAALRLAAHAESGAGEMAGLVAFALAVLYIFRLIGAEFDDRGTRG